MTRGRPGPARVSSTGSARRGSRWSGPARRWAGGGAPRRPARKHPAGPERGGHHRLGRPAGDLVDLHRQVRDAQRLAGVGFDLRVGLGAGITGRVVKRVSPLKSTMEGPHPAAAPAGPSPPGRRRLRRARQREQTTVTVARVPSSEGDCYGWHRRSSHEPEPSAASAEPAADADAPPTCCRRARRASSWPAVAATRRALVFSDGHLAGVITPSDITRMMDRLSAAQPSSRPDRQSS